MSGILAAGRTDSGFSGPSMPFYHAYFKTVSCDLALFTPNDIDTFLGRDNPDSHASYTIYFVPTLLIAAQRRHGRAERSDSRYCCWNHLLSSRFAGGLTAADLRLAATCCMLLAPIVPENGNRF